MSRWIGQIVEIAKTVDGVLRTQKSQADLLRTIKNDIEALKRDVAVIKATESRNTALSEARIYRDISDIQRQLGRIEGKLNMRQE